MPGKAPADSGQLNPKSEMVNGKKLLDLHGQPQRAPELAVPGTSGSGLK